MRTLSKISGLVMLTFVLTSIKVNGQELRAGLEAPVYNKKRVSVELGLDTKFDYDNGLNYKANMASLKLGYRFHKRFHAKTAYRQTFDIQNLSIPEDEGRSFLDDKNRYTLDLIYKTKRVNNKRIKNKIRYQNSDLNDNGNNHLRYKIIVDYKFSHLFKPFYGGEIDYELDEGQLKSVRIYLGNESRVLDRDIESFFIIENKFKASTAINFNYILGINIKL